jgi:tetratricopeptide (TPR) repeat protein
VEQKEKTVGLRHPETATAYNCLALLLGTKGEFKEAHSLYRRAITIFTDALGEGHPNTIVTLNNRALLFQIESTNGARGAYNQSTKIWRRALKLSRSSLGVLHPVTQTVRKHLMSNYLDMAVRISAAALLMAVGAGLGCWISWLWFVGVPLSAIALWMLQREWHVWRKPA